MRIISGKFKSIPITTIHSDATRPTSDKVKEAVYSRIGPYFETGRMLDLFSGSGNMALEAISRGIQEAYMVENSKRAAAMIKRNIAKLHVEASTQLLNMDYQKALNLFIKKRLAFDLVYLDPPYKNQQIDQILKKLYDQQLLKPNCDVICEIPKQQELIAEWQYLKKVKESIYGITKIVYYKYCEE